jgi:hypothetical protein
MSKEKLEGNLLPSPAGIYTKKGYNIYKQMACLPPVQFLFPWFCKPKIRTVRTLVEHCGKDKQQ